MKTRFTLSLLLTLPLLTSQAQHAYLLKDIRTGSLGSNPNHMKQSGNTIFFRADDGSTGYEMWKSDGTASGTSLYWDIYPGSSTSYPELIGALGGVNLFKTIDYTLNKYKLYRSDGTLGGSFQLAEFTRTSISTAPNNFTKIGNKYLFAAETSAEGRELWITDGTVAGTMLLKDIRTGASSSAPDDLIEYQGSVYFAASDNSGDRELWKTDGTSIGTQRFIDIQAAGSSGPENMCVSNNLLFFACNDGTHGKEIWKTDGTTGGTALLKDIDPANTLTYGIGMNGFDFNNKYVFTAYTPATGFELYISDGTTSGTFMLKDINPGTASGAGSLTHYAVKGNQLLFFAESSATGIEPWITDGTTSGTQILRDISQGTASSLGTHQPLSYNGLFYFIAYSGDTGREIYQSDGTESGTYAITNIDIDNVGYGPQQGSPLYEINGIIVFSADDNIHGNELWALDPMATAIETEITDGIKLSVFPNPSNGNFVLSMEEFDTGNSHSVLLSDLSGRTVYKAAINSNYSSFDCTSLSNGTYLITVLKNGNAVSTQKLILAR